MSGTLAAMVQFKLHTIVSGPFPIEDGFRFVVIVMDTSILSQGMETGGAIGPFIIFIRVFIIGLAFPEQTAAPAAGGIVVIVALLAQMGISAAGVVICPQAVSAFAAQKRMYLQTVGA